jgi:hypothetical protein
VIAIDLEARTLEMEVAPAELERRARRWSPPSPRVRTGYLLRYAAMVTSGSQGAVLEVAASAARGRAAAPADPKGRRPSRGAAHREAGSRVAGSAPALAGNGLPEPNRSGWTELAREPLAAAGRPRTLAFEDGGKL